MVSPECHCRPPSRRSRSHRRRRRFAGGRGGLRREGQRARGVGEQAVVVQGRVPPRQVVDGGIDATIAEHGAGAGLVGAAPARAVRAVAIRATGHGGDAVFESDAAVHAERGEDALLEDIGVAQARGALDDQGEERVGAVAVAVGGAGREIGCGKGRSCSCDPRTARLPRRQGTEHIRIPHLATEIGGHHVLVVVQARGVAQEVVQGYALGARREFRQPATHGILQCQQAIFGQQQHGGGGELLAQRGQRKFVSGVAGVPASTSARPTARRTTGLPSRSTSRAAPGTSPV